MRKCLPLTTLSQELVEHATFSADVREELLVNETEYRMIHGEPKEWARAGSPLRALGFYELLSPLEQRVFYGREKAVINVPRGIGKTTVMQHMLQKTRELGKFPSFIYTNAEVSGGFPSSVPARQTRDSIHDVRQRVLGCGPYAVRDAIATVEHLYVTRAMSQRNRQFVLNFDQLYGGEK